MTTISGNCQFFFPLFHRVLESPLSLSPLGFFLSSVQYPLCLSVSPDVMNMYALSISLKEIKIEARIKFG